jgi:hypothetical protein
MKRKTLMLNPEREFRDPRRLIEDQALSDKQKVQLLMNWRLELIELQRATEENMTGADESGEVTERLRKVTDALEDLGAGSPYDTSL